MVDQPALYSWIVFFLFKGNVLSESDIQILNIVLAEQLPKLKESGLSLTHDNRITKEEVVMHLQKIDQHDFAKILRNEGKISSIKIWQK